MLLRFKKNRHTVGVVTISWLRAPWHPNDRNAFRVHGDAVLVNCSVVSKEQLRCKNWPLWRVHGQRLISHKQAAPLVAMVAFVYSLLLPFSAVFKRVLDPQAPHVCPLPLVWFQHK